MQRDSVYYVQRGMNLLIGVNRLGTQSRVRSIYYLWPSQALLIDKWAWAYIEIVEMQLVTSAGAGIQLQA